MPFWYWFVLAAVLLIVEIATGTTYFLWPAAAATVVGFLDLWPLEGEWRLQLLVFAVVTVLLLHDLCNTEGEAMAAQEPEGSPDAQRGRRAENRQAREGRSRPFGRAPAVCVSATHTGPPAMRRRISKKVPG